MAEGQVLADIVAKVENRTTPKSREKLIFGPFLLLRRSPYRPVRGRRNNSSISTPNAVTMRHNTLIDGLRLPPSTPNYRLEPVTTSLPTTDRLRGPRCSLTASCRYDLLMLLVEENGFLACLPI